MRHRLRYTAFDDASDPHATGAQRPLPLRLGSQVQTLLSRQGRGPGGGGTGQGHGRRGGGAPRGGHGGPFTAAETPDAPAVEGRHVSWLRPAYADAPQGRRRLIALAPAAAGSVPKTTCRDAGATIRPLIIHGMNDYHSRYECGAEALKRVLVPCQRIQSRARHAAPGRCRDPTRLAGPLRGGDRGVPVSLARPHRHGDRSLDPRAPRPSANAPG